MREEEEGCERETVGTKERGKKAHPFIRDFDKPRHCP